MNEERTKKENKKHLVYFIVIVCFVLFLQEFKRKFKKGQKTKL